MLLLLSHHGLAQLPIGTPYHVTPGLAALPPNPAKQQCPIGHTLTYKGSSVFADADAYTNSLAKHHRDRTCGICSRRFRLRENIYECSICRVRAPISTSNTYTSRWQQWWGCEHCVEHSNFQRTLFKQQVSPDDFEQQHAASTTTTPSPCPPTLVRDLQHHQQLLSLPTGPITAPDNPSESIEAQQGAIGRLGGGTSYSTSLVFCVQELVLGGMGLAQTARSTLPPTMVVTDSKK